MNSVSFLTNIFQMIKGSNIFGKWSEIMVMLKQRKYAIYLDNPKIINGLSRIIQSAFVNDYTQALYGPDGGVCYALKRNQLLIDAAGEIRKCTCDLESEMNHFGTIGVKFLMAQNMKIG